MPTSVTVRVWEGDFGVASVDPDCLLVMTMLKMCKINASFTRATLPQWQDIPSLHYDNMIVTNRSDVILQATNISRADANLDIAESSQCIVYRNYFTDCYVDAFLIDCWIIDHNYEHAIKTWYLNAMPFPFSYMYLKKKRQEVRDRFNEMLGRENEEEFIAKAYQKAARCLDDIETMLKDGRRYMLGNSPSSLDAYIFSYLAITSNMPLPDPTLQNLVNSHVRINKYVRYISQKFFPRVGPRFKYVEPVNLANERASTKSLIFAVAFASAGMLYYAYWSGYFSSQ